LYVIRGGHPFISTGYFVRPGWCRKTRKLTPQTIAAARSKNTIYGPGGGGGGTTKSHWESVQKFFHTIHNYEAMGILGGPKKKEEKNPPVVYISILELIGVKPSDRNRDPGAHTSHGNCWLRFLFSFLFGTRSHSHTLSI